MLRINIFLVFCIIGLCAAATTAKPKTANQVKDVKEKRDAAVSTGPYSYDAPQKSFQAPIYAQQQQQQKAAQIEYHQAPQKVAPLDYYQQKQQIQAPLHVQPQQHYQEPAQQYPSSFGYPTAVESLFAQQPPKGFGEYSFSYPGLESFSQMPIVHYNQELNKLNSAYVGFPDFKAPSYSNYKTAAYQPSFSYGSPSPAYSFPVQSYAIPQQQLNSYVSSYAPSGPSAQSAPAYYSHGNQSPSEFFIPQTISISQRPSKIPDYAQGTKGLSHFSTVSSAAAPSPNEPTHYIKQQYEVPAYYSQYTQTERPFKASAYLGASQVDSHSEQSIANHKPAGEYLPPSKSYLPAKEYYTPEQSPVEYQIQYIQAPQKSYAPASNYLPSKSVQELPKGSYLPPSPPKSSYLPPSPPKSSYIPASAPQKSYLPPSPPKNSYLQPEQPKNNYLPPNNPFQTSYHSNSQSAPSQYQQQQQHQQQDSYESLEYQSVTPSGHK